MRNRDLGSGMETVRIRDPGWKKVGSGIQDKHPGSATLVFWSWKIVSERSGWFLNVSGWFLTVLRIRIRDLVPF